MSTDPDDLFSDVTRQPDNAVLLAGRYRVIRELGRGGMGMVYLARDEKLDGREFAIKMPPAVLTRNRKAVEQLRAEALRGMDLAHPNIVTLRGFEEHADGVFLVMDYIPGQTLEEFLEKRSGLSEAQLRGIFSPLATALDYAHSRGVVHRDIKPSNILLREDGTPLITDFGIARGMKESLTRITGKNSSGTLPYMSPEQLRGREAPSPGQDIYSFAATMYECLAGDPPFYRGEIAFQIATEEPPPLPGEPSELKDSIMRGLGKTSAERPATCAALLKRAPPKVPRTAEVPRIAEVVPEERKRGSGVAVALVLLLLIGGVAGFLVMQNRKGPAPRPAYPIAKSPTEPAVPPPAVFTGNLNVTHPTEKAILTSEGRVSFSGTLAGCPGGMILINDEEHPVSADGSFEIDLFLVEGDREVWVSALDPAGARSEPLTYWLTLDSIPPVIDLRQPVEGAGLGGESVVVSGRVVDRHLKELRVSGEPVEFDLNGEFTTSVEFAGSELTIVIVAIDGVGFRSTATRRIYRDDTPPDLEFDPIPRTVITDAVVISGHVNEDGCAVTVAGLPATIADREFRLAVPLEKTGTYHLDVAVTDQAGNTAGETVTVTKEDLPDLGAGYAYSRETIQGYLTLIRSSEWDPGRPQRTGPGTRGMLRATHLASFLEFVLIPAGTFQMGSDAEDAREKPVHLVTFKRAFLLCDTECTQMVWQVFDPENPSRFTGNVFRPVENMNARSFRSWLEKLGRDLRLPSEAEWEYACRAGGTGEWCFGSDEVQLVKYAVFKPGSRGESAKVKSKLPNAWGLFDMHGNVWELCEDTWHDSYVGAPTDGSPWISADKSFKVMRGGCYFGGSADTRSAKRGRTNQSTGSSNIGFRPVYPLPE